MKKYTTLLVLLVAFVTGAFAQGHNFVVFSEQGEKFYIVVNGVRQNNDPQTNVRVTGLNGSVYAFKVIFADANLGELDKTLPMPAGPPMEYTFKIKKDKNGIYVMRYFGEAPLAAAPVTTPGQTVIVYSATPVVAVATPAATTVTQTTTTNTVGGGGAGININVDGLNMGINVTDPLYGGTTHSTTTTTYSQTTTINAPATTTYVPNTTTQVVTTPAPNVYVMPGYNGPIGCNGWPMDQGSFGSAIQTIHETDFESTKLSTAKSIISSQCVTTDQIVSVCREFDFESTKLDFAKFAYSRVIDKGNYFKINSVFDFDSSKSDLMQFTSGH
jgi:hypothetical protein